MKEKYFFPLNYKYSAKFLGIIEYKILVPIVIYIGIIIAILNLLNVNFFVGFGVVILLAMPPILILSIGVNGQPAIPYFIALIKFKARNKIYIYK